MLRTFKYSTCKRFYYLVVFVVFWNLIFAWVCQSIFCDLGITTLWKFCCGGLVLILLDLKWIVLPASIVYFLKYPASAVYATFLIWPEFQRLLRWGDRTLWIRHATHVVTQPIVCTFGIRTAFLPTVTNYSQLHITYVGTVSEFSCGIVVCSGACLTEVNQQA